MTLFPYTTLFRSDLVKNLDVFGRIDVDGSTLPKQIDNFIIQKNSSNNFEVLVRLTNEETISNLEFAREIDGVSGTLLAPSKFGILDVQATESTTFRSTITGEEIDKLVSDIESDEIVKSVQFFGNTLTSKFNTAAGNEGFLDDRILEFYQFEGVEFTLPLWYSISGQSDTSTRTLGYEMLEIYKNGQSTGTQQTIKLASSGTNPTTLEPQTYDFYKGLKEKLVDEVKGADFAQASTITLTSSLDTSSKITKQSLLFSDFFYAIGVRTTDESWANTNRNGNTKIVISDPSQKVFFEKPANFAEEDRKSVG